VQRFITMHFKSKKTSSLNKTNCKSVYRERDPAGTINIGYNVGGLPDGKLVEITLMRKMVAYKANCSQFVLYDTFERVCDKFGACSPLPAVTR
jgi:hypothetical protein